MASLQMILDVLDREREVSAYKAMCQLAVIDGPPGQSHEDTYNVQPHRKVPTYLVPKYGTAPGGGKKVVGNPPALPPRPALGGGSGGAATGTAAVRNSRFNSSGKLGTATAKATHVDKPLSEIAGMRTAPVPPANRPSATGILKTGTKQTGVTVKAAVASAFGKQKSAAKPATGTGTATNASAKSTTNQSDDGTLKPGNNTKKTIRSNRPVPTPASRVGTDAPGATGAKADGKSVTFEGLGAPGGSHETGATGFARNAGIKMIEMKHPDGSRTVTETTPKPDGTKVVKVTEYDANGVQVKETTKLYDKQDNQVEEVGVEEEKSETAGGDKKTGTDDDSHASTCTCSKCRNKTETAGGEEYYASSEYLGGDLGSELEDYF